MLVRDAMDAAPLLLGRQDSLADAARALHDRKASAAVVVDGSKPVGILTERDLVRAVVGGVDPKVERVATWMSTELVTTAPAQPVAEATALMVSKGIRHLPVVTGSTLDGLLSIAGHVAVAAAARRPSTDFGTSATRSSFRGPYADGPPAAALEVDTPPIESFGLPELRRMFVTYSVLAVSVVGALARWVVRKRGRTAGQAASAGLVDGFIRLGPTFVKLGQLIASSPGLFPPTLSNAARRCLDEVPPFPADEVRRMIAEDLGRPAGEVFRHFDDRPLSAASIGQVHACVLPDGREAVVKLQRPNIRERMTTDLRIMYRLARLAGKTKAGASANLEGGVRDLHAITFQELNPALEAWRQDRFRRTIHAFGDNKWITAPEIHWEWCGPRIICMERVSGIPMDDFEQFEARGIDGQLVLRRGAKVWAEAVLLHGPFHGDMHAGNIWVLDDGRGCYLDFGIMGELTQQWRDVVRDIFYTCMFDLDFTRVAAAYRRVGVFPPDMGTDEEIGQRLGLILGPMLAGGFGELSLGDLISSSFDLVKQFGGTAPQELSLIGKQLLYIERYTKVLAPDYQVVGDPFIMKNIFPEEAAAKAKELGVTFPE
jgi:predicted unusual protein kinase regulating ubiquinone biosynthesis (AarF/ABC1/UbiB family)/predicted transcriptional regulator